MLYSLIESAKLAAIERFRDARAVYQRARDKGRLLPEGLRYLDSSVASDLTRCFQLMECDSSEVFDAWFARWNDLAEFEVVPVVSSGEAAALALSD